MVHSTSWVATRRFVVTNQSSEMDVVAYYPFQVFGLLSYSSKHHHLPLLFGYHDELVRLELLVFQFDMGSMVSRLFAST